jgi:hypothetical protein
MLRHHRKDNLMADWPPAQVAARVAEIIRHHPEKYDQVVWLETSRATTRDMLAELDGIGQCDTTACVAGWAVIVTAPPSSQPAEKENGFIRRVIRSGVPANIEYAAQQALGLSDLEAAWLFSSYRERTEVLAALDELAAGHRLELPEDDEDNEDA